MTLRYLLDTAVLSEPIVKKPDPAVLARLEEHGAACATAAPIIHELRYGALLLSPSRRRKAIERYVDEVVLRIYPVLPYDHAGAERHAEERARLARLGRPAPFVDSLIAAVAVSNGLTLVTRNVHDFHAFRDLSVESWHS